jgi:uncharacterized SAM-binding protein YcdF (DUF218 family)
MIRRASRWFVAPLAIVVIGSVLVGVLPVTPGLYRLLLVSEPPRRADAIVVLGGGVIDEDSLGTATTVRLVHGLRLHHRGYAPLVILTGGNPVDRRHPESEVMRRVAEELGITPDVLVLETVAERTATQGEAVARLARARNIRTILLVTSPEHSRRAALVFRKTGLEVISTPPVARKLPPLSITFRARVIATRVLGLHPLVYELTALGLYWWRGWL